MVNIGVRCHLCPEAKTVARGLCGRCYARVRCQGRIGEFARAEFKNGVRPGGLPCAIAECDKKVLAKGLCQNHYMVNRRETRPEVREKERLASLKYSRAHVEECRQSARQWAKDHPEQKAINLAAWRAENKPAIAQHNQNRYARKKGARGKCTKKQRADRAAMFGGRCYLCGCDWYALPKKQQHMDHVIPLSRGGTNWPANLRPVCPPCNSRKWKKLLSEMKVA